MQRSFGNKKTFFCLSFSRISFSFVFHLAYLCLRKSVCNFWPTFTILESYWPFLALASLISTFHYYQLAAGGPNLAR